ncbi:MAG: cytidine deaminase [Legionellales bacterium]|nr:cytidine deaminase [Legionellales bacterium]
MNSLNPLEMDIIARKKDLESILANSYSPYSEFKVAASIRTDNNEIFTGVNIENSSYSLTMCAEASAIASMVTQAGTESISDVVIINDSNRVCPPCGACLQRLIEFSSEKTKVYLATSKSDEIEMHILKDLIPLQFSKEYLNKS